MRVKKCGQCGAAYTPKSNVAALSQHRCPPCWAEYQRELKRNPRMPSPCRECGEPTQDARASVKFCPEHRFQIREKRCAGCGKMWLPRSWSEFQCKARCHPCLSVARKAYRRIEFAAHRKPLACETCGKPTGDIRQSVRYCKEHGYIGQWWSMWKKRAVRKQGEYVARLEELERLKPLMEEKKWLALARKELMAVKSLLKRRSPAACQSLPAESRPRATSRA